MTQLRCFVPAFAVLWRYIRCRVVQSKKWHRRWAFRFARPKLVCFNSATKRAVKLFTQGLSIEVGSRGITVNNVQLGPIDTDLNPAADDWAAPQKAATALDRYGNVDEIAAMVAFVAGPESSYITGASLTVDGGMNA